MAGASHEGQGKAVGAPVKHANANHPDIEDDGLCDANFRADSGLVEGGALERTREAPQATAGVWVGNQPTPLNCTT
jgi:hypothetical protein